MRNRNLLAVPLAAGLLVTGLSACGSKSNTPTTNSTSLSATASSINPKSRDELKDGGTFTLPIGALPTNWNPMNVNGNGVDASTVRGAILPAFFDANDKGEFTTDPNYLKSADNKVDNGKTVTTFVLNDKAKWNDGTPIGLNDFVATWHACDGTKTSFDQCTSTEGYDQIESIKQGDNAQTIIVTYKKTYPDWQAPFFGGPLKADSIKDQNTFDKGWPTLNNNWLSGPFKVGSIDQSAKTITLVKNPAWWGDSPKLDSVVFKVYADEATANAYANGQIDGFDIGVNAANYKTAQGYQQGEIRRAAGPNWRHLTFNTASPSYKDKAVRRAVVQYLDREALAKSDLAGMNWDAAPLNNTVFLNNQTQYVDMAKETGLTYDPTAGDKTLTDDGYKQDASSKKWMKDGKPLTIHVSQIDGVKVSTNEATTFQNQMSNHGITVVIDHLTQDNWGDKLAAKQFDGIFFTWVGSDFPYVSPKQFYKSKGASNFSNYSNPDVDKLIDQVSTEADQTKRNDLVKQIETAVWNDPQILPLYQRPDQFAVKKSIANYGAFGLATVQWQNVGYVK